VFTFEEYYRAPVSSDNLVLNFTGLVHRRLGFRSGAGALRGNVGIGQSLGGFTNVYGRTGVIYGLSRHLGLAADYTYFAYGQGSGVSIPAGLAGRGRRHVVSLNLLLWAPIFQTRGRTNVTG
jgi:hypothetical protein